MDDEGRAAVEAFKVVSGEAKFAKSGLNRKTENVGLDLLLTDGRFQVGPTALKRQVLAAFGAALWSPQSFDAFMTVTPQAQLTADNLAENLDTIRLVEMKTTRKAISDERLNGFFFGATAREFDLAELIPDHHRWAFVVLNSDNRFGRPYFVLMTHEQLKARVRSQRIQFQISLQWAENGVPPNDGIGPDTTT